MRLAGAAHAAGTRLSRAGRFGTSGTAHTRGKCGKLLGQFGGTAMRAFGAFPIAGTHQHLAVFLALPAMKFVDWHAMIIFPPLQNLKP